MGVVVRTRRTAQEPEAVGQAAKRRAERVRRRALKPAIHARGDAAEHGTAVIRRGQQRVETVKPPDRQQVGRRAAGAPEDVLCDHESVEILDDAFEEGQLGRTAVVPLIAR
jgi:hypothetical protein